MPKFIPQMNQDVCQGGIHRLRKGVEVEYADGHPMIQRLRQMSPIYVKEIKAKPAPAPKPKPKAENPVEKQAPRFMSKKGRK